MGEILFSKKHLWIKIEKDTVKIGITEYAKEKLGSILFLNLPDIDDELEIGRTFGDIESVKTVSELIAPINGVVTNVNEDLVDEPDEIEESPYEAWFIEVKVKDQVNNNELMKENQYKEYLKTL